MKKFNCLLIVLACIAQTMNAQVEIFTSDYIALTVPQHYYGEITYVNDSLFQEVMDISDLKNDKTLLRSLPNIVSNVTVYEVEHNGELKVLGIGISGKNKVYQVIYDYSQTQTLVYGTGEEAESVLVGIGVRMVAKVKTKKAGINLSSPFGLTANTNKIEGSLEVRVTGISSPKINGIIPTTTDLSPSSISVALQAVATIKSHIYDKETIITPQYLGYNKIDNTIKNQKVNTQKIN
ncbi:hypothetical protein [Psychroserpens jangbogonensis]|uniref:hypothetical protein n=1 Tax=Psychroserpens jangbogonensis TaxID=1484460 RepID=UPI00053D54AA|nr:hypothetical protein [Psychroserpens jangbogonensis]